MPTISPSLRRNPTGTTVDFPWLSTMTASSLPSGPLTTPLTAISSTRFPWFLLESSLGVAKGSRFRDGEYGTGLLTVMSSAGSATAAAGATAGGAAGLLAPGALPFWAGAWAPRGLRRPSSINGRRERVGFILASWINQPGQRPGEARRQGPEGEPPVPGYRHRR